MRNGLVVTLFTLALLLGSLPLAAPPAQAQLPTHALSGMVCSADDRWSGFSPEVCQGGALPGVTVTLSRPGPLPGGLGGYNQSVTTDASGAFRFTNLSEGTYDVRLARTGFQDTVGEVEIPHQSRLEWSMLGRDVQATGTVHDLDGTAIAGASLSFDGRSSARTSSGSSGGFSVGLQSGHYWVSIQHADHQSLHRQVLVDGDAALAFQLQKAPERTAAVTGTVRDQDGNAVSGATVEVYQYGGGCCYDEPRIMPASDGGDAPAPEPYYYHHGGHRSVQTDAQGRFTIAVYPGWLDLYASKEGYSRHYEGLEVRDGENKSVAVTLEKFPEKTARIAGQVTASDTGRGLSWVSVSVESPRYGIYECSVRTADRDDAGQSSGASSGSAGAASPDMMVMPHPYYDPGCRIEVRPDGSFEGTVTPGYTILRVYYEHWRSCTEAYHADGSYSRTCGQDYFAFTRTLELPADATTRVDVALVARPGPDATVSGYVVDKETQRALAGVQVSFGHQDSYGYGWATTDEDGSFKLRLRSGYHQVYVYADGYHRWEGVLHVPAGRETPFDIHLTRGQDQWGYCCWGPYPMYRAMEDSAMSSPGSPGAPSEMSRPSSGVSESTSDAESYVDLRGGLGPYDAEKRAKLLAQDGRGLPAGPLLFATLALFVLASAVRRRQEC